MKRETIRLATRSSELAKRQADVVREALEAHHHEVELVKVETTGDQVRDELVHRLGTTGAFVRSLDERVLEGAVDGAVHSLKDMPTEMPEELIVAAVPERAPPNDVLVTPDGTTLDGLPTGATVGTSSLRRRAQLLAVRPDLAIIPLRGNVDTRVEKLLAPALQRELQHRRDASLPRNENDGPSETFEFDRTVAEWIDDRTPVEIAALDRSIDAEYDAIVLAAAGLKRIGLLDRLHTHHLPIERFVPAPGQGVIAVTMCDTNLASAVHRILDVPRIRVEVTVERTILSTIGGGCIAPIGAHAIVQGESVRTHVHVSNRDGTNVLSTTRDLPVRQHAPAARELAEELVDKGARELIKTTADEPFELPVREDE